MHVQEHYLVDYVIKKRNPLSSMAAIICAMKQEMVQYEDMRRHMRKTAEKFYRLVGCCASVVLVMSLPTTALMDESVCLQHVASIIKHY